VSVYPTASPGGKTSYAIIGSIRRSLRRRRSARWVTEQVAEFFCEPGWDRRVIVPRKGWLKAMSKACTILGILLSR